METEISGRVRNMELVKIIDWIPKVWHHLNRFLEAHSSSDVTIGRWEAGVGGQALLLALRPPQMSVLGALARTALAGASQPEAALSPWMRRGQREDHSPRQTPDCRSSTLGAVSLSPSLPSAPGLISSTDPHPARADVNTAGWARSPHHEAPPSANHPATLAPL